MESSAFANHVTREIKDAHKGPVRTLGWNCLGHQLATGSADETVRIWNIEQFSQGKDTRTSELIIGREPNALSWNPQHPDQLITSAADNFLKLWDTRTAKKTATIKLRKNAYLFLAWHPTECVVAAVHQDSDIYLIDIRKHNIISTLQSKTQVNHVRFSKDGKLFFRTLGSGCVEVFSYPSLTLLHTLMGHTACTHALDLSPSGKLLATGGTDASLSIFELDTLICLKSIIAFDFPIRAVSFNYDSTSLAFFSEGHTGVYIAPAVDQFESDGYKLNKELKIPTQMLVADLSWNPKNSILAYTGSYTDLSARTSLRSCGNFNIFAHKTQRG